MKNYNIFRKLAKVHFGFRKYTIKFLVNFYSPIRIFQRRLFK